MEQKRVVYCANCGEKGHVYRECTGPITSFGIIAFKVVKNPDEEKHDLNESLQEILGVLKSQNQFKLPVNTSSKLPTKTFDHRGISNFFNQNQQQHTYFNNYNHHQQMYYYQQFYPNQNDYDVASYDNTTQLYWNYWTIDRNVNWNYALMDTHANLHHNYNQTLLNVHSNLNLNEHGYPKIKFLLIQRKDTMGYIDFIRGKYPDSEPQKSQILKVYLEEMTISERESLLTKTFDQIWSEVWNNKNSKIYKNEYNLAKEKFEKLDISFLIANSNSKWISTEFGIPKGRRCIKEQNLACAEREFFEETGYSNEHYMYLTNYPTVIEEFEGTNGIRYRHIYYLVKMNDTAPPPKVDQSSIIQTGEVQNIGWFTNEESQIILRPYDIEKKKVLDKVHRDILNMNFNFDCSPCYYKSEKNKYNKGKLLFKKK